MSQDDQHLEARLSALKEAVALLEEAASQRLAAENAEAVAVRREAAELGEAVLVLGKVLREASRGRPDVHAAVARVAEWLAGVATDAHAEPTFDQADAAHAGTAAEASPDGAARSVEDTVPTLSQVEVPLVLGAGRTTVQVIGTAEDAESVRQSAEPPPSEQSSDWDDTRWRTQATGFARPVDLSLVVERCRLKAEGWDWAARFRASWEDDPPDAEVRKATYDSIISRAKALPNCYIWQLHPEEVVPPFERMVHYAQAYRNLASAAQLALDATEGAPKLTGDRLAETYQLLAEAQSAVRAALDVDNAQVDTDQSDVFRWLRVRTNEDRVLVPRHMKLDDPAELAESDELAGRLSKLRDELKSMQRARADRKAMLNKIKYHVRMLEDREGDEALDDWRKIVDTVESLIAGGMPASDSQLRELLIPVVDDLPASIEISAHVERVLTSIDAYLASRDEEDRSEPARRTLSPEAQEVAALLEGKVVVLIGGEIRREAKSNLERDLKLSELRWVPAAHHQSYFMFESAIAKPDTAVVVLAIRWASHSFENIDELCRRYSKPFVRLPGGYSPNQMAKQILDQVGETLRVTYR